EGADGQQNGSNPASEFVRQIWQSRYEAGIGDNFCLGPLLTVFLSIECREDCRRMRQKHGSVAMIGVSGKNCEGAIDLLDEHESDKLVWPGHRPESQTEAGSIKQCGA